MKYGIYQRGILQFVMDTDCKNIKEIVKILREHSREKIPSVPDAVIRYLNNSIDYLPLTQEGWQEFEKEGKK